MARRSALHAAAAALGGLSASALLTPRSQAGGNPLVVDAANTGAATTTLTSPVEGAPALEIVNPQEPAADSVGGAALAAFAGPRPKGLPTQSASFAVLGHNAGESRGNALVYGVIGHAHGPGSTGIAGDSDEGIGVSGGGEGRQSIGVRGVSGRGKGGFFASARGIALEADGPVVFSRARRRKVPAGVQSHDIPAGRAAKNAFVLATIQGPPQDIRVVSVDRKGARFRVHFDNPVPPGGIEIGFFIVG